MEEIKKGKVKECKQTDFAADKYGNLWYNVKFEDDTEGLYLGKKPEYFEVDKEITYQVEVREGKNSGKNYNKISLPPKEKPGSGNSSKAKDPEKQYRIARTVAMKVAVKIKRLAPFNPGKLSEVAALFFDYIWEKSDNGSIEGNAIVAQSALDLAAEVMQDVNVEITNMEMFFKYADNFYNFITKPKEDNV